MTTKINCVFVVEPIDSLKCLICLEIAREARQHEVCGKLFCKECIEKNRGQPCPNCRARNPKYFSDKKSDREIEELAVKCSNVERGCDWKGTLVTLDKHMEGCELTLLCCPNKCVKVKDGDKDSSSHHILRKDLKEHLNIQCPNRNIRCKDCGIEGKYAWITGKHEKICVDKVISCPNLDCGASFKREKAESHQGTCEYAQVACKYDSFGCPVKKMRKEMPQHEKGNHDYHLNRGIEKVQELEDTISYLSTTLNEKVLKKGESFAFKLSEYLTKKANGGRYNSNSFYTFPGGYRMCIGVFPNGLGDGEGTHVSVYTRLLSGSFDDNLDWPFLGSITFELLNQQFDENHICKTRQVDEASNMHPGKNRGYSKFASHSCLNSIIANYLEGDALYFRVTVHNKKPWLIE